MKRSLLIAALLSASFLASLVSLALLGTRTGAPAPRVRAALPDQVVAAPVGVLGATERADRRRPEARDRAPRPDAPPSQEAADDAAAPPRPDPGPSPEGRPSPKPEPKPEPEPAPEPVVEVEHDPLTGHEKAKGYGHCHSNGGGHEADECTAEHPGKGGGKPPK